ncbi:replicative DNA helicase [Asticcacaulis endophyticus]|uniref:DNA 5'-3' helicase n=1 Tax=Asticcacaulis endophyticus TaxID=1395890 RepID=A0A918UM68_9CAUL|nr:DnaB-like helicase C-terminal domain-containing protein [Asticcacaulis endophyticus]GGZ21847.1 replicative DNA helicase [Asticcacaulis endophyticus]
MHALDAEQAVIGIALYDQSVLPLVMHLHEYHFHDDLHGFIWGLIREGVSAGKNIGPQTIAPLLGDSAEKYGGSKYLFTMIDKCPPTFTISDNAGAIINAWQVNEVANSFTSVAKMTDALAAIDAVKQDIARIEIAAGSGEESVNATAAATDHLSMLYGQVESGRPSGLMTGLKCIDDRLGGLKPGHVIVTGGRPSMGKTAFSRNVSFGAARLNPDHRVVFYALEMTRGEMSERCLSHLTFETGWSVAYKDISSPSKDTLDHVSSVAGDVPRNLFINDCSRMSIDDIRRDAWRHKSRSELALIVIDYVQLLTMPDYRGKTDAKALAEMTAEVKRMAKELGCTIMLVAQLNRNLESRENKRPQMSDLRDSGGFEQDANAILFPYREVVYLRNNPPTDAMRLLDWEAECAAKSHEMVVICAKNRGGEVGDDVMWASMAHDVILNERPDNWRGA